MRSTAAAHAPSRFERALGLHVDGIDRGAARHEQPVPLLAAEAQVRTGLRQVDLADQLAARRVAAHAVLLGIGPTHAAPDIAVDVGANASPLGLSKSSATIVARPVFASIR